MIIIVIAIYGIWYRYNDICAPGDSIMKFGELTVRLQLCACTASVYLGMLIVCVRMCACMVCLCMRARVWCVCVCLCACDVCA